MKIRVRLIAVTLAPTLTTHAHTHTGEARGERAQGEVEARCSPPPGRCRTGEQFCEATELAEEWLEEACDEACCVRTASECRTQWRISGSAALPQASASLGQSARRPPAWAATLWPA